MGDTRGEWQRCGNNKRDEERIRDTGRERKIHGQNERDMERM